MSRPVIVHPDRSRTALYQCAIFFFSFWLSVERERRRRPEERRKRVKGRWTFSVSLSLSPNGARKRRTRGGSQVSSSALERRRSILSCLGLARDHSMPTTATKRPSPTPFATTRPHFSPIERASIYRRIQSDYHLPAPSALQRSARKKNIYIFIFIYQSKKDALCALAFIKRGLFCSPRSFA